MRFPLRQLLRSSAGPARRHYQYQRVCRFWTPDMTAYKGLGQTYVDDPQFRADHDKIADGPAVCRRDAMGVHADARPS
ncbi:TipAS antibiotic-recognition domain-containing protein [Streptomyces sp. x-80]|uniref:TipAS antibiotic-recognition domain-containing protein n=1 Tax=Streptomyces sp. x-80 TaxID=2789282 RepID=UPI0039802A80